MLLECMR